MARNKARMLVVLTPVLTQAFKDFPWLWGMTSRWFPGDLIEVTRLTIPLLRTLVYSTITEVGGSSWFVHRRFKDGIEHVERIRETGSYGSKCGLPLAHVARRLSNVHTLAQLRWDRESSCRCITVYRVLQGSHGSTFRELCTEALKDAHAVRVAMKVHQIAIDARVEEAVRKDAKKRRFNPIAILRQYRATADERMERLQQAVKLMPARPGM